MPATEVRSKLDQIKGHLVWMPLDFLKDAEMAERGLQVSFFLFFFSVPQSWTTKSTIMRSMKLSANSFFFPLE